MIAYEIWTVLPEDEKHPVKHGCAVGDSFYDACRRFFGNNPMYCSKTNTFWGCVLFSNVNDIKMALPAQRYNRGF